MKANILLVTMFSAFVIPMFASGSTVVSFVCFGSVIVVIVFLLIWAKPKRATPPPDTFDGSTLKIYPQKRKKQ
jgi:hypothetical protein